MEKFDKVMLVDDDEVTNFLSKEIISHLGIARHIDVAEDGLIAWDHLTKQTCPDLIFLDIRMPRVDGFDFLDLLTQSNRCQHVKVVMLTSSIRPEDKGKAMAYNCVVDYFEKPLTDEIIKNVAGKYFH